MTDLHLFPLPDAVVPVDPPERLSPDARRTQRNRVSLANGRHPATGRPLLDPEWGYHCRDCAHCVGFGHNLRTYWKCRRGRLGVSHSAASDIRVGWAACELFAIAAEWE